MHDLTTIELVQACVQNFLLETERQVDLLFRVCLGNPEKTIQGALAAHLERQRPNSKVVQEAGLHQGRNRTSIDILILNDNFRPIMGIEMKHFSANQGTIRVLLRNMNNDCGRHQKISPAKEIPILHVGLYSVVSKVQYRGTSESWQNNIGFYRFISAYCKDVFTESADHPKASAAVMKRFQLAGVKNKSLNLPSSDVELILLESRVRIHGRIASIVYKCSSPLYCQSPPY